MNNTQIEPKLPAPAKVHIYTGNGKGKTTAALGQAFRAAGHGLNIHILHFMKNDPEYGEMHSAMRMGDKWQVEQWGRPCFVSKKNPAPEDVDLARRGLARAKELAQSCVVDLLVLDELINALDFNLVELDGVLDLLKQRCPTTEVILTGRNAPVELVELADLVTEMRQIKHYYDSGTPARVGIES